MAISKKLQEQMQRSSWIRKMFEEAERLKKERGEEAIVDLSLGNPIAEPPDELLASLKSAVIDSPPGTHRYMNNAGYPETRKAVATLVSSEQGVQIGENNILMTCGAAGAMNVTLKALLDPGDEVIILAPFFVEYKFYADNHGGVAKVVESDEDFQPNAARFEEAITDKTKAVIINNPNNPTGVVYSVEAVRALTQVLTKAAQRVGHPIYLISDEVYRHMVYDNAEVAGIFKDYPDAIITTSCSKDLGLAGERIGYIAINPRMDIAAQLLSACVTTNRTLGFVNANALMQRAVRNCLDARVDMDFYAKNRDILLDALDAAGLHVVRPGGAFFVFPKCPKEEPDDVSYCAKLLEKGIIAVPASGFGRPGHIRLSYSVDRATMERAAKMFRSL